MGLSTTNKNWEGLAQRDALWAICTTPGKEGGKWDIASFFELGETEIAIIWDYLDVHGLLPRDPQHALDFGCGVGRLSRALTSRFAQVTGVDVAQTMVEKGRTLNDDLGDRLQFVHNTAPDLTVLDPQKFDFIYTSIVLQHIPDPASLGYISELIRLLKPDGTLVFQIPTEDIRKLSPFAWLKTKLRIRERLALIGIGSGYHMSMNPIPENRVQDAVKDAGGRVVHTAYTNHTDPDFDGSIQFMRRDESKAFVSGLFCVKPSL